MAATSTWNVRVRVGSEVSEITVVGQTESEARKAAGRIGNVISLERSKKSAFNIGMSRSERFIFLMRMSTMISSRFPVTEALKLMI